jgi:hypothetical protein
VNRSYQSGWGHSDGFSCEEHRAVMDNMKFLAREVLPYMAEGSTVGATR